MKMKKWKIVITIAIALGLMSGCAMDRIANDYSPENIGKTLAKKANGGNPSKMIQAIQDKDIANAFADYYSKDRYTVDYSSNLLTITKKLVYFSQNVYMGQVDHYITQTDAEQEFFNKYKTLIKKRGNNYKVLTAKFNQQLWETKLSRSLPKMNNRDQLLKWSVKPAIAEFNNNGELVSVMLNTFQIAAAFNKFNASYVQSDIDLQITVLTGSMLSRIKNNISMNDWSSNTIQAR